MSVASFVKIVARTDVKLDKSDAPTGRIGDDSLVVRPVSAGRHAAPPLCPAERNLIACHGVY